MKPRMKPSDLMTLDAVLAGAAVPEAPAEFITAQDYAKRERLDRRSAVALLDRIEGLESGIRRHPVTRRPVRCWWVKGTYK